MKVLIVGCGRLGRGLARELDRKGVDVTMIDKDPEKLEHLHAPYKGQTQVGVGFDQDVLEAAGIMRADALVATTDNDETNALIARIARNHYKVPRVIARLYDPRKAAIYTALGIQTISTTSWGIQRGLEMLSYTQMDNVLTLGESDVSLVRVEVPALLAGRPVQDLTRPGEVHVMSIGRANSAFIPTLGTTMQSGDVLYIAVATSAFGKLKIALGL